MAEEPVPTETEGAVEKEEAAEEIDIDLNAVLLEVMVKRTELLEKLISGEASLEATVEQLNAVKIPSLEKRRRRRSSA